LGACASRATRLFKSETPKIGYARALYFFSAINSRSVNRRFSVGGRIAPQQEAAATARVRAHAVCFLNNYNEGNYLARRQAECDESLLHIVARKTIARELDG
jgi:hypothetical protein